MTAIRSWACALSLGLLTLGAQAQPSASSGLKAEQAWVRATVAQQKATGAFMQLSSGQAGRIVEVRSPVAGVAEIHEMKMEGSVMKMRALPALELAAGQVVELKPGGYHVMLMDLKTQVKPGDQVPLTLVFEAKDGKRETLELKLPARTPAPAPEAGHGQHKH
ncbi:copper chaperone PCu(A)C [Roseateles sp. DAIF2]|uniref:copper chaperone PCu(A)C n=1 Tax=Roseateles sp. DAIF2 TaxID=2714952 RepID=UPI0018A29202|nr:copper chaperone PCu(A)C [Roseateles sp. DAIF2]QPF75189.1 copper chaperone PCu(A)C [Roseateles sp. DAIF2]